MRAWALLASFLLLAVLPLRAARTLVFLGDSLTAGYGVETAEAYPALIEAKLKARGLDWKVVNAGVSGDTTAGALRRMDWVLRQKVDVLFVCLGANDGLRGVPAAEAERNLGAIVDRARSRGATVVLAGIQIPENYGAEYRRQFGALFPRLAKKKRLPFLPFLLEGVAMRPELNQADRIHPNAEGHKAVAEHVWTVLAPVLAGKP